VGCDLFIKALAEARVSRPGGFFFICPSFFFLEPGQRSEGYKKKKVELAHGPGAIGNERGV
jgi:hypothetical protein